jgi:serine/threonine protein kinase
MDGFNNNNNNNDYDYDFPKYDVVAPVDVLGRGGFGIVIRAQHRVSGEHVAIKINHGRFGSGGDSSAAQSSHSFPKSSTEQQEHDDDDDDDDDEDARRCAEAAIFHESKILMYLRNCPGVCRLRAFGNATTMAQPKEKIQYIAIDLAYPITFGFGDRRWVVVLGTLCRILEAVHTRRVLHNDIKRSNIMLRRPFLCDESMIGAGGNVRLIDFGLAKFMHTHDVPIADMQAWTRVAHEVGVLRDDCDECIETSMNKFDAVVHTTKTQSSEWYDWHLGRLVEFALQPTQSMNEFR